MTMTQTDINVPVDGTITSAKLSGALTTPAALTVTGAFTSIGIDDNATSTAITIDSSENVALAGAISIAGGIGELSAPSANDLAIYGTASGHNGIRFHDVGLLPTNNAGAIIDNDCDIGIGTHRFKDLYLSGGVHLGGISTPNFLDDYEEGTWTPVLGRVSASTVSYTNRYGYYTKVGRMVYVSFFITINAVAVQGGSVNFMLGLPFTIGGVGNISNAGSLGVNNAFATAIVQTTMGRGSEAGLTFHDNINSNTNLGVNWVAGGVLSGSLSYFVD